MYCMTKEALESFLKEKKDNKNKKKKTIKNESEIIEVVEKTILVEDGRQLLNG